FCTSIADAEAEHDVDPAEVRLVLNLQDVRPGVVPLPANPGEEGATAAGDIEVRVNGSISAADDIDEVPDLDHVGLCCPVPATAINADSPASTIPVPHTVGRAEQIPLPADTERHECSVESGDVDLLFGNDNPPLR